MSLWVPLYFAVSFLSTVANATTVQVAVPGDFAYFESPSGNKRLCMHKRPNTIKFSYECCGNDNVMKYSLTNKQLFHTPSSGNKKCVNYAVDGQPLKVKNSGSCVAFTMMDGQLQRTLSSGVQQYCLFGNSIHDSDVYMRPCSNGFQFTFHSNVVKQFSMKKPSGSKYLGLNSNSPFLQMTTNKFTFKLYSNKQIWVHGKDSCLAPERWKPDQKIMLKPSCPGAMFKYRADKGTYELLYTGLCIRNENPPMLRLCEDTSNPQFVETVTNLSLATSMTVNSVISSRPVLTIASSRPALTSTKAIVQGPALTSTKTIEQQPVLTSTKAIVQEPALTSTKAIEQEPALTSTKAIEQGPVLTSTKATVQEPALTSTKATVQEPALTSTKATVQEPALTSTKATVQKPALTSTKATVQEPALTSTKAIVQEPALTSTKAIEQGPVLTSTTTIASSRHPSKPKSHETTSSSLPLTVSSSSHAMTSQQLHTPTSSPISLLPYFSLASQALTPLNSKQRVTWDSGSQAILLHSTIKPTLVVDSDSNAATVTRSTAIWQRDSFGPWFPWKPCPVSCGGGRQTRKRRCEGDFCLASMLEEEQVCNKDPCPVNGGFSSWGAWSCNATCGGGVRTRKRLCNNPRPDHGGVDCFGVRNNVDICASDFCPVHGGWTEWTAWSACDKPCNTGMYRRWRYCTNPSPLYNGNECQGNATEGMPCNTNICPESRVNLWNIRFDLEWRGNLTVRASDAFNVFSNTLSLNIRRMFEYSASNSSYLFCYIHNLKKGSVAANFTLYFSALDSFQILLLQDSVETDKYIGKIKLLKSDSFYNVSLVPASAPLNFTLTALSTTSIKAEWGEVPKDQQNGNVTGYILFYRELTAASFKSFATVKLNAIVLGLSVFTEYVFRILSYNRNGNGLASESMSVRTFGSAPRHPPKSLSAVSTSGFEISVDWVSIGQDDWNGIPLASIVWYGHDTSRLQAQSKTVPFPGNFVLLQGLLPVTTYVIDVCHVTKHGQGPCQRTQCTTLASVPSRAPSNVRVHSKIDYKSIDVTWTPISMDYVHGDLKGYKVVYKLVKAAETDVIASSVVTRLVHPSLARVTLPNLQPNAKYAIRVLAVNEHGDGVSSSKFYGETCSCPPIIYTNYAASAPYIYRDEAGNMKGLFADMLQNLTSYACGDCKSRTSVLDFVSNGKNGWAEKKSLTEMKKDIDEYVHLSFPIFGSTVLDTYNGFAFVPVFPHPGVVYFIIKDPYIKQVQRVGLNLLNTWPIFLINILLITISGFVMWALESNFNDEFPRSFFPGVLSGMYWAYITMGTHGYGDKTPTSFAGRSFAMIWMLVGMVNLAIFTGALTSAFTSTQVYDSHTIYGAEIAAINDTVAFNVGVQRNAKVNKKQKYTSIEEVAAALKRRDVRGALVDVYSAATRNDLFEDPNIVAKKLVKYPSAFGFVLSGDMNNVAPKFRDYLKLHANELLENMKNKTENFVVGEPSKEPKPLFHEESPFFKYTVIAFAILFVLSAICGVTCDIRRRYKAKRVTESANDEALDEIEAACQDSLLRFYESTNSSLEIPQGQGSADLLSFSIALRGSKGSELANHKSSLCVTMITAQRLIGLAALSLRQQEWRIEHVFFPAILLLAQVIVPQQVYGYPYIEYGQGAQRGRVCLQGKVETGYVNLTTIVADCCSAIPVRFENNSLHQGTDCFWLDETTSMLLRRPANENCTKFEFINGKMMLRNNPGGGQKLFLGDVDNGLRLTDSPPINETWNLNGACPSPKSNSTVVASKVYIGENGKYIRVDSSNNPTALNQASNIAEFYSNGEIWFGSLCMTLEGEFPRRLGDLKIKKFRFESDCRGVRFVHRPSTFTYELLNTAYCIMRSGNAFQLLECGGAATPHTTSTLGTSSTASITASTAATPHTTSTLGTSSTASITASTVPSLTSIYPTPSTTPSPTATPTSKPSVGCTGACLRLASPGQQCGDFCKSLGLFCSSSIETGNSVSAFTSSGVVCNDTTSSMQWKMSYDPAFLLRNSACTGYMNVNQTVHCTVQGFADANVRRLCKCVTSAEEDSFNNWVPWSACIVSCGGGTQLRTRTCKMDSCTGDYSEQISCNEQPCPIDGGFSSWTVWSSCSVTCGGGTRSRTRDCNNPSPLNGGLNCFGLTEVSEICGSSFCPVHGGWTEWTAWSACDKPCNTGMFRRWRYCTNPSPLYNGNECQGNATEGMPCNTNICPAESIAVANLRLRADWAADMSNHGSQNFTNFYSLLTTSVRSIYDFSNLNSTYHFLIVESLKQGSVIATFTLFFSSLDSFQVLLLQDSIENDKYLGKLKITGFNNTYNTTIVPTSAPLNFTLTALSTTSIKAEWGEVPKDQQNGNVTGYILFYREKMLISASYKSLATVKLDATILGLSVFTEYVFRILSYNRNGNGLASTEETIHTKESTPSQPPTGLAANATSGFSIIVYWKNIAQRAWNGIPVGTVVEYSDNNGHSGTVSVAFPKSYAVINNLVPVTTYIIDVCQATAVGKGPCQRTQSTTLPSAPTQAPGNLSVDSFHSHNMLNVSWDPISPRHTHDDLKGYKIIYTLLRTGTTSVVENPITIVVHPSLTKYTLEKLQPSSQYSIEVLAFNKNGDGVKSTAVIGETCSCPPIIYTNYAASAPYIYRDKAGNMKGLFADMLQNLTSYACGDCKSRTSVLDFVSNGKNGWAEKKSLTEMKKDIDEYVHLSFPIFGSTVLDTYNGYAFVPVFPHPGVVYFIIKDPLSAHVGKIVLSVLNTWPMFLINILFVTISGFFIWALDSNHNSEEFPRSCLPGVFSGMYWAFITMGTHGYGDLTPRSIAARLFAVVWIIIGLINLSIFTGALTTALTTSAVYSDSKIYGVTASAVYNSVAYKVGITRNAEISNTTKYTSIEEVAAALKRRDVRGALVDVYSAATRNDLFEDPYIVAKKLVKYPSAFGFVLSGDMNNVAPKFRDYLTLHANELLENMKNKTAGFEVKEDTAQAISVFSPDSPLLSKTLIIIGVLLIIFFAFGVAYDRGKKFWIRGSTVPEQLQAVQEIEDVCDEEIGQFFESAKSNLDSVMDAQLCDRVQYLKHGTLRCRRQKAIVRARIHEDSSEELNHAMGSSQIGDHRQLCSARTDTRSKATDITEIDVHKFQAKQLSLNSVESEIEA
eukprot:gene15286-16863_t